MLEPAVPPFMSRAVTKRINALPLDAIRTETVLSRLPIHTLSKKGKVSIHITKRNERGEVDLLWKVSSNTDYGVPRQLAYKLDTIIINKKIDELGRPIPKVIRLESLTQIYKELGVVAGGGNKNQLKNAFLQNAFTAIVAKLKYKGEDGTERTLEAGFTRYSVIFTGERLPDGTKADGVYLILNEPYWEVLNNAPIRPLDYNYLKALSPTAQRFYEIVSYKMFAAIKFKHPSAKLSYSEYCMYSAQQRYYDFDHVKKQMYKVHRPHLASGYLMKASFEPTVDTDGKPDWVMSYIPGPKARAEFKVFNGKHSEGADTLDQESVLPIETPEASAPEEARKLVRYFHRCFHENDSATPLAKDLAFAAELIEQYGMKKSRFIVEYSLEAAATTKYAVNMLVGIRQYVDAAIKKFDTREEQRQEEKRKAREEDLQLQYERYLDHETERIKSTMSPDELAEMESVIRSDLAARGIKQFILEAEIRLKRDKQLAVRAGVLPYEEWRAQLS